MRLGDALSAGGCVRDQEYLAYADSGPTLYSIPDRAVVRSYAVDTRGDLVYDPMTGLYAGTRTYWYNPPAVVLFDLDAGSERGEYPILEGAEFDFAAGAAWVGRSYYRFEL